jgi:hypothetical protein
MMRHREYMTFKGDQRNVCGIFVGNTERKSAWKAEA